MFKKWKQYRKQQELKAQRRIYSDEVNRYLYNKRDSLICEFSDLCQKYHGRIAYEDMLIVLGKDFPKPQWIHGSKTNEQIVAFFAEVGIPFRADETHLYFP